MTQGFTLNSAKKPEQQAFALQGLLTELLIRIKSTDSMVALSWRNHCKVLCSSRWFCLRQQRGKEIKAERKAERANNFVTGGMPTSLCKC